MKKIFGWVIVALMLALMVTMFVSQAEHRGGLSFAAAVAMLVLISVLARVGKRRAARDPEYAARLAKAVAAAKARQPSRMARWRNLAIWVVAAIALAAANNWWAHHRDFFTHLTTAQWAVLATIAGAITLVGLGFFCQALKKRNAA